MPSIPLKTVRAPQGATDDVCILGLRHLRCFLRHISAFTEEANWDQSPTAKAETKEIAARHLKARFSAARCRLGPANVTHFTEA